VTKGISTVRFSILEILYAKSDFAVRRSLAGPFTVLQAQEEAADDFVKARADRGV